MFRKVTSIVLIISVITANFSKLFVYASFELNKRYIATELCENRDNPVMQCEGQCYLSKKLAQAHENDKQQESQRYHFQEACISERLTWIPFVQSISANAPVEVPLDLPRFSFV